MKIRQPRPNDFEQIAQIYIRHHQHEIPSRENLLTELVAEDDESIIAYGMTKLWAEMILVMDKNKPLRTKVEAFKHMLQIGTLQASVKNLEHLHLFTSDEEYAKLLIKHFNFEPIGSYCLRLKV